VQCCNIYDSYTLFQDGFKCEQAKLLEEKVMLQKLKLTSYAFIYFLLFGFSFIALQVTTEEVEAAGVCEPVDRIKQRNNADSRLWFQRCAQSGSKNTCGNMTEWPRGDGGRCEMTTADTVAAQDNMGVCEPVQRIRAMKGGSRNHDYILWVDRCQVTGSRGQCGHPPEWPRGDGGRCEMATADTVAAQDVNPTHAPVNRAAVANVPSTPIATLTPKEAEETRAVAACISQGMGSDDDCILWYAQGEGRVRLRQLRRDEGERMYREGREQESLKNGWFLQH
jgi:hypothetical protein